MESITYEYIQYFKLKKSPPPKKKKNSNKYLSTFIVYSCWDDIVMHTEMLILKRFEIYQQRYRIEI